MMKARRNSAMLGLVMLTGGCRQASEPPPPPDLSGIEEKLDALGTTLDEHAGRVGALEQKLQTMAEESEARRAALEEAREADRPALRPAPPTRSPDLRDPFAPDADPPDEPPAITDRSLPGQEGAIECKDVGNDTECDVHKAFYDSIFDEETDLAKQARIVPSQKDGKTQGYKFYGIRRGSLPKAMMIKNGDMLVSANGAELDDVTKLMTLSKSLRKAKKVTLGFVRKGKPRTITVHVK